MVVIQFEICPGGESWLRYLVPSKVIKVKLFMKDFRKKEDNNSAPLKTGGLAELASLKTFVIY